MESARDADADHANAPFIPAAAEYPARWAARAAAFRAAHPPEEIAYGPAPRQRLDLFAPPGAARGLMVFLHGGFWVAYGRGDWSHRAAGALARGWAVALPSYTLAPEARIGAIAREAAAAVAAAAARVAGPLVVAGHSAGGHLAARLAAADLAGDLAAGLAPGRFMRVVPVSPLADLGPLIGTAMNARLRIDAAEAAAESPARLAPAPGVEVHVMVGGQERPAFLWQARLLAECWACPWTVLPGRHHFDVIDSLESPEGEITRACLDGL